MCKTLKDFRKLARGEKFEDSALPDDLYGLTRYLKSRKLLQRVLKIIRRVRNVYRSKNVSVAVYAPINKKLMREFKKEVSASGLAKSSNFNIYAVIDNPSEIILTEKQG